MFYIKISNLLSSGGVIDYKGLDVTCFETSSQFYHLDTSYCVLKTSEEVTDLSDVKVITEKEYKEEVEKIKKSHESITSEDEKLEDRVAELEDIILMLTL